jgi:DEAD/DEAH box helicase domain-containing protein
VPGYKKIKFYTLENVGYGEIRLPDQEMHTTAAWWSFDDEFARELGLSTTSLLEGLAGLSYTLRQLASLRCLCDPGDLGTAVGDREGRIGLEKRGAPSPAGEAHFRPVLYLYETYAGGSGLAEGIQQRSPELLADALLLISSCPCAGGCPSCVGPAAEGDPGAPTAKEAALKIMGALVRAS